MRKKLKDYIKDFLFKKGYRFSKISTHPIQNPNPFLACNSEIKAQKPVLFDVGMNHGQTLQKIKEVFADCEIHGFEASKYCFADLEQKFSNDNTIRLNNKALGDTETVMQFNEYSWDAMNSFLTRAYGSAKIVETYDVNVTTIDAYCAENKIEKIHVLKSDTEGFELNVLKGGQQMMAQNKIQFVFVELFFDLNFVGQSSVGQIFSYLEENGFSLVRFYDIGLTGDGLASKGDALFINKEFN